MSTLRTVNGVSISRRLRNLQRQVEWVALLKNNSKKLKRLASLVCLAPGWDKPNKEKQLKLQYIGNAVTHAQAKADLARIEKVLGCVLAAELDYTCLVRLGRTTVEMTIAFPWMTPLRKAA